MSGPWPVSDGHLSDGVTIPVAFRPSDSDCLSSFCHEIFSHHGLTHIDW